jgi:membrane protein CcdC involved in cytochrome C biogenesis
MNKKFLIIILFISIISIITEKFNLRKKYLNLKRKKHKSWDYYE